MRMAIFRIDGFWAVHFLNRFRKFEQFDDEIVLRITVEIRMDFAYLILLWCMFSLPILHHTRTSTKENIFGIA